MENNPQENEKKKFRILNSAINSGIYHGICIQICTSMITPLITEKSMNCTNSGLHMGHLQRGHQNCMLIAHFLPATELAEHFILRVKGLHV